MPSLATLSADELFSTVRAPDFDRNSFHVTTNVITPEEEEALLAELHNPLRRLRYENTHWDHVCILSIGA